MNNFFDITHILTTYGYPGIFIIIFLESGLFFALPGDSLLFTSGLLVAVLGLKLPILISVIFLATFLGGIGGYLIGVYLDNLRKFSFFRLILKEKYINKAHEFFVKYGKFALVFSRFVPIVRTFTPIVAGIARVPYKFYLKYSLIGAVAWPISMTLTGYFLGRAFPIIKDYLWVVAILVVLVSVVPILIQVLKERKSLRV
jgi:membrane-associated protein